MFSKKRYPSGTASQIVLLLFAVLLVSGLGMSSFWHPATARAASMGFVTRSGSQLQLNGQQFRFAGANIPWLGIVSDKYQNSSPDVYYPSTYMVDDAFQTLSEMGGTVVRAHTLGASQGCALCIEPALGQFNETALRHVDYAIKVAHDHNVRLVIPFVDSNEGWYYGGINVFTAWRNDANVSQFYTDPNVISDFEAYISMLVNRVNTYTGIAYKNDPTIMAWETGNEISGTTLTWLTTISDYIKSQAPNQLVMDGDVGNFSASYLAVPHVDMYVDHFYHQRSQPWPTTSHAQTITSAGKVYCVCEFGWDTTNYMTQTQLQTNFTLIQNNPGVSGDLFWALEPHADLGGFSPVDQPTSCNGSEPGAGRIWWGLYYTGIDTYCQTAADMAQRAQILRAHAYAMSGVAVPAHAIPPSPRVLTASGGTVIWRGSAGAGTYTIQRATAPTGPWQTVCNACVTDTSGGWTDPAPLGTPAWYQVIPLNLDNVRGPASSPVATVPDGTTAWVEDATPTGASLGADGGDAWTWVATNPNPYAGSLAHQSAIVSGEEQHYFTGATTTITPQSGSLLYTWVYLDPTHVPTTVMLQWNDGQAGDLGWQHRAYWGTGPNCVGWGTEGTASRIKEGALPPAGGWVRLSVPASDVGLVNVTVSGMSFTTCNGRATYDHSGVATDPSTWIEDAPPTGATLNADGGDAWNWIATNPAPYSGTLAHQSALATGEHQHFFTGTTDPITPNVGSVVYSWVYLNPTNLPSGIVLQWNDGHAGDLGWQHRAYWGTNCTGWGVEGTASRFHAGNLPPAGGWVQLAVPSSAVGIENVPISGMAFTTCDGQATYDRAGVD